MESSNLADGRSLGDDLLQLLKRQLGCRRNVRDVLLQKPANSLGT